MLVFGLCFSLLELKSITDNQFAWCLRPQVSTHRTRLVYTDRAVEGTLTSECEHYHYQRALEQCQRSYTTYFEGDEGSDYDITDLSATFFWLGITHHHIAESPRCSGCSSGPRAWKTPLCRCCLRGESCQG